ncbi:hypothetical protein BC943DRAFT_328343 [Umbelopsis sp. AD052]|nr:hypothetical protein BC943DRAFT_328343 [Umbelopsis sp. AD052]
MENLSKDLPQKPSGFTPDASTETAAIDKQDVLNSTSMDHTPTYTERYPSESKSQSALNSLPARAYLDEAVVPTLLEGMQLLISQRPADPLHFLGHFLIDRSNQQKSDQQESTSTGNASVSQNQDEKMY